MPKFCLIFFSKTTFILCSLRGQLPFCGFPLHLHSKLWVPHHLSSSSEASFHRASQKRSFLGSVALFHADSHHLIPLIIVKTSFQLFILTGKNLLCSFCKTNLNLYSCVINQKIWKNKFAFKRKRGWMPFQNLAWYLESSSPHTILYNLLFQDNIL